MKILVVNAGSSSHKLSLYDLHDQEPTQALWKGALEWGRDAGNYSFTISSPTEGVVRQPCKSQRLQDNLKALISALWTGQSKVVEGPSSIEWIGHRVVHGGKQFQQPAFITTDVKNKIRQLIPLAPLHNPFNLEGIEWMEKVFPGTPQLAVFDTAFHAGLPAAAQTYPLPYEWKKEGIQRYGFHGISHQYCGERVAKILGQDEKNLRIINCHLGNGCSVCAIQGGASVDTTMGFTPLEGLMMGTRCGSIDPGILLYLLRAKSYSEEELDLILNFQSGLKGICGFSDMRDVLKSKEPKAQLALDMYVHRLRSAIGGLIASLGGIDVLSFTGGIGENASLIRELTCRHLTYCGLQLDEKKNDNCQADQDIATDSSSVRLVVLHTEEEWMIARSCLAFNESRSSLS